MRSDIGPIISRIKFLAKEKKISMRKLAKMIGMTQVGLHRSLSNRSIKVSTLCDISDILEVEPFEFFIDHKNFKNNKQTCHEKTA